VRASREAFVETRAKEQITRRRFTVEEYHRMGEAGILREDERVELRNVKLPLYARANIREAWILDLPNNAVERHNDPSEEGYRRMERVGPERSLASEMLPNLIIQTNAVIG
jgi:hypothetical protein